MAKKTPPGNKELPSFSELKPIEQTCIMLKAQGYTYAEIRETLTAEKKKAPALGTLHDWFYAKGRLFQAYTEYNETMADVTVTAGKNLIKHLTKEAAVMMGQMMRKTTANDRDRIRAGQILLAKYVPDKQIVLGQGGADDDLPEEIADDMDKMTKGGADDNPPADAGDGQEVRSEGDENVPTAILQQPAPADESSDPPA